MYKPIDWKAYLKPAEALRLEEISAREAAFSKERRQIRQRARARAVKAQKETAHGDR